MSTHQEAPCGESSAVSGPERGQAKGIECSTPWEGRQASISNTSWSTSTGLAVLRSLARQRGLLFDLSLTPSPSSSALYHCELGINAAIAWISWLLNHRRQDNCSFSINEVQLVCYNLQPDINTSKGVKVSQSLSNGQFIQETSFSTTSKSSLSTLVEASAITLQLWNCSTGPVFVCARVQHAVADM